MAQLTAALRRRPFVVDALLGAVAFGLGLLSVRVYFDIAPTFRFAVGVAVMALLTWPLALRRAHPPVTLGLVTLAILLYTVFDISEATMSGTVSFIAIYSVGAFCTAKVANWVRGVALTVLLADLLWLVFFRQIDVDDPNVSLVLLGLLNVGANVFFFVVAWVVGDVARSAKRRAAELEERNSELQRAHDVIEEQAILDERVRIAREVHDVVAHHVSVMGVQAGAARHVMSRRPDQAAELLSAVEASSRQAVAELHRLLGFLRTGTTGGNPRSARDHAPQPSLGELTLLLEQMQDAELDVALAVDGMPQPLPPSVDLSAYRIIQEALTNVLKHSGPGSRATVGLVFEDAVLRVSVVDDGRGRANGRTDRRPAPPVEATGHGLVGMRERVALHGGLFTATHLPGSGFEVTASFPLPLAAQRDGSR